MQSHFETGFFFSFGFMDACNRNKFLILISCFCHFVWAQFAAQVATLTDAVLRVVQVFIDVNIPLIHYGHVTCYHQLCYIKLYVTKLQAASNSAEKAINLPRADEQVKKAGLDTNRAATTARVVVVVKAFQNQMDGKFCNTNV